jgi:hypothetical protein
MKFPKPTEPAMREALMAIGFLLILVLIMVASLLVGVQPMDPQLMAREAPQAQAPG